MTLLHPGDVFPDLDLHLPANETITIPEALGGKFGVVLFNRGAWCPFCTTQLRGFERAYGQLQDLGAEVVSLSVDDEATTKDMLATNKLTFPVGHSADAHHIAEVTGAFINTDPLYLQATGFILDPGGTVLISTYSSGAIGRLTAEDTIGMITYVKSSHA